MTCLSWSAVMALESTAVLVMKCLQLREAGTRVEFVVQRRRASRRLLICSCRGSSAVFGTSIQRDLTGPHGAQAQTVVLATTPPRPSSPAGPVLTDDRCAHR